jgi:hypothetical protein
MLCDGHDVIFSMCHGVIDVLCDLVYYYYYMLLFHVSCRVMVPFLLSCLS